MVRPADRRLADDASPPCPRAGRAGARARRGARAATRASKDSIDLPPATPPASSSEGGPRRRRGGRGRGTRPAGEQARTSQSAGPPRPAPVVVPVGADATVLPTDTTFDALGVPAPLVEVLTAQRHHRAVPDPGRDAARQPRRPRRPRPRPHRLGQDPRLRLPLVARLAASDSKRAAQAPALADPRADPRAGQPGRRRRRPAGPRPRHAARTTIFGGVGQNPQVQALAGGVDVAHRLPRPARGPHRPGPLRPRRRRDHRPRRGRPHGRPRLPARRQAADGPHPEGRPAAAVLRHARQRRRRAGQALPEQPGRRTRSTRPSRRSAR